MNFLPNIFTSSSSDIILGKKSTTHDVVKNLHSNDNLAGYVPKQSAQHAAAEAALEAAPLAGHTVALVTGGNSGIGAESVKALAMVGIKVILCARNIESATAVVQKEIPAYYRHLVTIQKLDLADMDSIQQASTEIKEKFKGIDIILHNAGVMAIEKRTTTKQGFEMQFGTNHIGHFMLTRLIIPIMNRNARIVTVSSSAQMFAKVEKDGGWDAYLEGDKKYTPWGAYGNSKLANCMFAKTLQDQLEINGRGDITSVSLHPGIIKTGLWKHSSILLKPFIALMPDSKSIEQGAATSVYCMLAKYITAGAYHKDCAEAEPTSLVNDTDLREQLWDYTELLIMEAGFSLPKLLRKPSEEVRMNVKGRAKIEAAPSAQVA